MKLTWFGHSSLMIESGHNRIYIDPYFGDSSLYKPATLVLVSRFDYDHCSLEKIKKMMLDSTQILGTAAVAREVFPSSVLHVGETKTFGDIEVHGMAVINPKTGEQEDAIGFLITLEDKKIFYMADSGYEPEMEKAKPDLLLIPVGGTRTHGEREATKIADILNPQLAIPIHWGGPEGTADDAHLFAELTKVPTRVLKPGESIDL